MFPQLFRVLPNFRECKSSTSFRYLCDKKKEKSLFISSCCYSLTGGNSVFQATTITFSFVVFVLLVVNLVLIWRLRRAVPNNRKTTASIADRVGQSDSPRDQYVSEPDSYMELRSRPPEGKLSAPLEYTGLQCIDSNPDYYNVGIDEKNKRDGQEDIYYEVRDT